MSSMTVEQAKQLRTTLAQLEFFWTFAGRVQLLKEAGLFWLIPHVNLEGSPQEAAFRLVRLLGDHSAECHNAVALAIAAHPNS